MRVSLSFVAAPISMHHSFLTAEQITGSYMQVNKTLEGDVILHSTLQHPNIIGFKRVCPPERAFFRLAIPAILCYSS